MPLQSLEFTQNLDSQRDEVGIKAEPPKSEEQESHVVPRASFVRSSLNEILMFRAHKVVRRRSALRLPRRVQRKISVSLKHLKYR